ncbi:hypothetical protein SH139x_003068 [Planctomycetaceae bacterium SH139]
MSDLQNLSREMAFVDAAFHYNAPGGEPLQQLLAVNQQLCRLKMAAHQLRWRWWLLLKRVKSTDDSTV